MSSSGMPDTAGGSPFAFLGILLAIVPLLILAILFREPNVVLNANGERVEATHADTALAKRVVKGTLLERDDSSIWVIQTTLGSGITKRFYDSSESIYHNPAAQHPPANSINELQEWIENGKVTKVVSPDDPRHSEYASRFVRQTIP
jgi:hypothetical protein